MMFFKTKIKSILFLIVFFSSISINAQNYYIATKIYTVSDVYMPAIKDKNQLKVATNNNLKAENNFSNFYAAFVPFNNFVTKIGFRQGNNLSFSNRTPRIGSGSQESSKLKEFQISFGYNYFINFKKINKLAEAKIKNKRLWKYEWKLANGKTYAKNNEQIKQAGLLLEANIGYSNGFTQNYTLFNDEIKRTINTNSERYNFDASLYLITNTIFEASYNLRFSLLNFKKIKLEDYFSNSHLVTKDIIQLNDPFFIIENTYKINFDINQKIDLYLNLNQLIGKEYNVYPNLSEATIVNISNKFNFSIGLAANISNIF